MEWKFEHKIFLVLIVLSIVVFFIFNDKYEDPKTSVNANTSEITYSCDGDYYLQQNQTTGNYTCYNPAPFGHTPITTPMLLSIFLTIGSCLALIVQKKREFFSNKIIFLFNRYKPQNFVITKSPDVKKVKGYTFMRSGYDDVLEGCNDEIYVGKDELVYNVAGSYVFWGKALKISVDALYEYLGRDFNLLKDVLEDYNIIITKNGIEKAKKEYDIYIPIPIIDNKIISFLSIRGKYGFEADRFEQVIKNLIKTRHGLDTSHKELVEASKNILEESKDIAQTTSTIAEAHGVTRRADIVNEKNYVPPEQRGRYDEVR